MQDIPGSEIQKGISGPGFLRLWGWWMGAWQHGESYMIGECVKIYKKISQEGHF